MNYEYNMVQMPPNVYTNSSTGDDAAIHLKSVVDKHAINGWEFYRVDTVGVHVNPGCLAQLFGQKSSLLNYYVVTFRRLM